MTDPHPPIFDDDGWVIDPDDRLIRLTTKTEEAPITNQAGEMP
jgi:hypothetical protein